MLVAVAGVAEADDQAQRALKRSIVKSGHKTPAERGWLGGSLCPQG